MAGIEQRVDMVETTITDIDKRIANLLKLTERNRLGIDDLLKQGNEMKATVTQATTAVADKAATAADKVAATGAANLGNHGSLPTTYVPTPVPVLVETSSTPTLQPFVVPKPKPSTPIKCSMECLDDETCQVMPTILRELSFPAILSPRSESMYLLLPSTRKGNEQQTCLPCTQMKVAEDNGERPIPWPSFQHANISEGSSKHMLAVKPPEGRGSVGPKDLIVPVCRIEHECISAPVHIALWCLCLEQILRSASTHGLYTPTALKIIHRVTQSTTRTWNPGIVHTVIHCSLELFALRAPLMYGLRVELEGLQAMLVSLVELKIGPSWKRTLQVLQLLRCFGDFTSFGQYSVQPTQNNSIILFIMSASLICLGWSFMLWDPGNLLRFLHLISSDNQFLSLEKFKESVASISIYMEWAPQEMVLFCWKSQLSIARDMCPLQHLARKFQYRPWNPGVHNKLTREEVQPAVVQQRGELMIIDCISHAHAVCTWALYWDRIGGYHRTTILAGNTHWGGLLVQNFGEDNVLELDHEQNTDVLGVIPGILLLLQGPHGLDLSTVRETPGVYVVDIMLASAYSEVVDTQVQWDPGDFLPSMDDGYDLHQAGQGSAFVADSYGTSFRPHLPDDQSELDTWDPGGVCRSGLRTSQNLTQDAHEFTKTCVQLTLSDLPPFLPLLPECWYCTMTEVTRKYMGSAAKSGCLMQSDDTYLDNHCLINSSYPSCELTINIFTSFHGLAQEDNAEPLCYREQGATYGQVELILAKLHFLTWKLATAEYG